MEKERQRVGRQEEEGWRKKDEEQAREHESCMVVV